MKTNVIILLILISSNLYSQQREIHLKTYADGDTSLWYKWRLELCGKIGLDTIEHSGNKWNFRFWTDKQVIDIWKDAESDLNGKITTWTEEYTSYEEEPTNRILYKSRLLKSATVNKMVSLIDSLEIEKVPDEELITGWSQGYDGITYIIETANSKEYFFKTYWTPTVQDSLKEAEIVQEFVERSLRITDADKYWDEFVQEIPYECYINGGPMVTCKIITRRERKKYRKERENYRQRLAAKLP